MDEHLLPIAREIAATITRSSSVNLRTPALTASILRGELDRSALVVAAYFGVRHGIEYAASIAKWKLPAGKAAKRAILEELME